MATNPPNEEDDTDMEAPEDQLPTPDRPDSDDPRKRWLEAKVRACLFSEREERIRLLLSSDTVLEACSSFLDIESVRHLFIFSETGDDGHFTAQHNAPQSSKSRVLYFTKATNLVLTDSNIDAEVIVNECHPEHTLEELLIVSQEIFFPLISDGQNQEGWPDVISKEISESFNRFLANSYITIGHTIGKTLLPLPPQEQYSKTSNFQKEVLRDKDRVHMLENAVVTWTKQIKDVLKQEPEMLLQEDQTLGPGAEFDFWTNKADNLNSIHEQLNGERIGKVMSILEVTKSTYYPAFDRLCKEVKVARAEANDNLVFLRPAKKYYDVLHGCDFLRLSEHFRTIMRVTLLVWKHSQFYNTPVRLVVLIREIGNDIIRQACAFMAGGGIWSDEPKDAVSKLRVIIGQCVDFKDAYFEFKNMSERECEENPWRFQSSALFGRLDSFLERCHDVLDLMQTLTQFNTLDRVEIGGTKGKTLTSSVQQIFLDFQQSISVFKEAPYDVMNIDSKAFEDDFYSFRLDVNELERRLASVIIQAFDDSTTILGSFKLLDSFEGLLERDILHSELTKKHADMLIEYLDDMNQVQEIFNIGNKKPLISDNAPPHAGAVSWVRGLLQRVEDPMQRLRVMGKIALDTEEGRESEKAHRSVVKMLSEFESAHIQQWARDVANTSEAKLKLPLLRRELVNGLPLLYVNFDSALVCLIREVKYFLSLSIEVPEAASAIYRNEELFRVQTGNLDLIINLYNHVIRTLLDVEKPLVQQKMDNIDKVLQRGLKHMNWKSHTISEFIAQCTTIVREVHTIVATIKDNVALTQRILASWSKNLLIQRKAARTYLPEEFLALQQELTDKRNAEIVEGGQAIHQNLSNSQKVLRATRGSAQFKAYVDYVNLVVIEGLANATHANCKYLLRQVDPEYLAKHDVNPLLEIQLRLAGHGIIFSPELGTNAEQAGVRDLAFSWITSFHNIGMLVKRIDTPITDGDYLADIQDDTDVKFVVSHISALISENEQRCEEFRASFEEYSHLWTEDVQDTLAQFLSERTPEGASKPELSSFEERINVYRLLEDEIRELPGSKVVGWLKIDVRPLRNSLLTCVGRWREAFQRLPMAFVTDTLQELLGFFATCYTGLDQDVFDSATLEHVFGLLRDVRKREEHTNSIFEPLRATVLMLSKYGVNVAPEVYKDLEAAAGQWAGLKVKAALTKDRYTSAQQNEAVQLKTRAKIFAAKLSEFRALFLKRMPLEFSEDHEHAYELVDSLYSAPHKGKGDFTPLVQLQQESERLTELQDSFELEVHSNEEIRVCTREAQLLKTVWDHVALVVVTQSEWKRVKWSDVVIAPLVEANQMLLTQIQELDEAVRAWPVYQGLKTGLENMQVALPLVELLRHPAMRPRHWKHFMRATGVSFAMDDKFTLGDLLVLKLHKYEEDVQDIVERSQKELLVEQQLQALESTWARLLLQFEPHGDDPELATIRVSEGVMESLKEHIVALQTLHGSKYVQGYTAFLEAVTRWQTKLGKVDSVVSTWVEVQKRWSNLYNIFTSADVREQLPADSKRFDEVDADWKALMREAADEQRVIEACNIPGRLERVEHMLLNLEICERSLSSYLEAKRIVFPRLYFVADSDLLDVLSKGKYPWLMSRHLKSCFDNIVDFEFEQDEDGSLTRRAIGMRSSEGEYVEFLEAFDCEGLVEVWLKRMTRHTHVTIETKLSGALDVLEGTAKAELLFAECAQVTGLVFRIRFNHEVNQVFDMLGQGDEHALHRLHEALRQDIEHYSGVVMEELESGDRTKVTTVMTLEVHHRDILATLNDERVESRLSFIWLSQLRYSMSEEFGQCRVCIADYECLYAHEYLGNSGSLVLTPLTHRCYLTLTQAMQLHLAGAPMGPAGVGKTETVKELGRALGVMVYVFNCTDQMDSKSVGSIFKGLAQVGAWGCFDEFNRIQLPVLSVLGTQLKTILDAVRYKKERLVLEGAEFLLQDHPYCNAYFTLNPHYKARADMPENVKALFRPCAMIQPDVDLIAEVVLMAEGFGQAKELAAKMVSLCKLCDNLLSQQKYYDWNLRSIKTMLLLAGQVRRAERGGREEAALLRVVRDFNVGRLVPGDVAVFLGLLADFFPGLLPELPPPADHGMAATMAEACALFKLQPQHSFIHKTLQLRDTLAVRWSVFVLGPPGSGKSEIIRVLCKAQNLAQDRTVLSAMNPKAVTRDELYGNVNASTREWKDGLLSQVFRDFAKTKSVQNQYLVLDGDVDAQWIESMNTVMDNNKTLTLASNERIQMTFSMRLLFEVGNLTHASPASISRGGVIFVSEAVVDWKAVVQSWVADRDHDVERSVLTDLFQQYLPPALAFVKANLRHIIPISTVNYVHTTCYILEGLLGSGDDLLASFKSSGLQEYRRRLEGPFVYSTIWGLAGALAYDRKLKYDELFDKFWRTSFSSCRFPDADLVFDYFWDAKHAAFEHWSERTSFALVPDVQFEHMYIATPNTLRLSFLQGLLVNEKRAVMFVGFAGTGKTALVKDKFRSVDQEVFSIIEMDFNFSTDSLMLQTTIEGALEQKSGRVFGPPGNKRAIYFIDNLNMPQADAYGTQQPIALLRQHMEYGYWYDRKKLAMNEIHSIQYLACMNPAAGSFTIDPRLQRQFATFCVEMPSQEMLFKIYSTIASSHFNKFDTVVHKVAAEPMVRATLNLFKSVSETFLPTNVKFYYVFNLREISAVVQGLCRSLKQYYSNPTALIRLWMHECERVFCDRLQSATDIQIFHKMLVDICMKWFDEYGEMDKIMAKPLVFTDFTTTTTDSADRPYCGIADSVKLTRIVEEKLVEYNETHPVMRLVMFDQAVLHVCRITRTLGLPSGHALLIGLGGSGKQSLAKLSAFICGHAVEQIVITPTFNYAKFLESLKEMQLKAGLKETRITFIINESQIIEENLLVAINDFLSTGGVTGLFSAAERAQVHKSLRQVVKQAGTIDTMENCWELFTERCRSYLHMCLCFSPAGTNFRLRARQFPAILNCTNLDFFHPWQQDALVAVAASFLPAMGIPSELVEGVSQHMSFVHGAVSQISEEFLEQDRRHNYTTPKSFLVLIDLYAAMLKEQQQQAQLKQKRLNNGLSKLYAATEQVSALQNKLLQDLDDVVDKTEAADKVLEQVTEETKLADQERMLASGDEEKCAAIVAEVNKLKEEYEEDLKAAEPMLQEAMSSMQTLDKKALLELKALTSPPPGVEDVFASVMVLTAKTGVPKDLSWGAAKKVVQNADGFLRALLALDKDHLVSEAACSYVEKNYISKETFQPDRIKSKSAVAGALCSWAINICKYYREYEKVKPKIELHAAANAKLLEADKQLAGVRGRLTELDIRLDELTKEYQAATQKKNKTMGRAEQTRHRAGMAERLVASLSAERERWYEEVSVMEEQELAMVGDVLLASAFVCYIGAFTARFRTRLLEAECKPDMQERRIPLTPGLHPLDLLAHPATRARWYTEGLPMDQVSAQNAAIVLNTRQCPLLIDPQLQGIVWLKTHLAGTRTLAAPMRTASEESAEEPQAQQDADEEDKDEEDEEDEEDEQQREAASKTAELRVVKAKHKQLLAAIEVAISNGETVLIEGIGETIDAVLEPVISRAVFRKGRSDVINFAGRDVDFDPNFKLYLQTKLPNPHFRPETAAQTTIVNFMITMDALHEQLLGLVVQKERPELLAQQQQLVEEGNSLAIQRQDLELRLLSTISDAEGDILAKTDLIEGLEQTKVLEKEILERQVEARSTQAALAAAMQVYGPVAKRGVILYGVLESMWKLNHLYRFSMSHFLSFFLKGLATADEEVEASESVLLYPPAVQKLAAQRAAAQHKEAEGEEGELAGRVEELVESSCLAVLGYAWWGLLEPDRLVLVTELAMRLLASRNALDNDLFALLVKGSRAESTENPLAEWLDKGAWEAAVGLQELQVTREDEEGVPQLVAPFGGLCDGLVQGAKRFREWLELDAPERVPLPGEWSLLPDLERLLVLRALRPDRILPALTVFVARELGTKYVARNPLDREEALEHDTRAPILFILSAGADPLQQMEARADRWSRTVENGRLVMVALGQGQEAVAEAAVARCHLEGAWLCLHNLHLSPEWTSSFLEDCIDRILRTEPQGLAAKFRLFLSTRPAPLSIGVLEACIKVTDAAPEGLKTNLCKALQLVSDEQLEQSSKPREYKALVFALCVLHAVMVERNKFGAIGWNQPYHFDRADVYACSQVAFNYLETNHRIAWTDLRFLFGDVVYGGHITDSFDVLLLGTYLDMLICDELMEGCELLPGLPTPSWSCSGEELQAWVRGAAVEEAPSVLGLHASAEIALKRRQGAALCAAIDELRSLSTAVAVGASVQERAGAMIDEIAERLPAAIAPPHEARAAGHEERGPYLHVLLQEVERMNRLLEEIQRSILELRGGLHGDMQISELMEGMMAALAQDSVPAAWEAMAYPSLRPLHAWLADVVERAKQLVEWSKEPAGLLRVTWIAGLFMPQALLMAVAQTTASNNHWPLYQTEMVAEMTKKGREDIAASARDGVYVHGLFLEGARWDEKSGTLDSCVGRQLCHALPVMLFKAIPVERKELLGSFTCPIFKTPRRGKTFVFVADIKSKSPPSRWLLAGVAMLMEAHL